MNYVFHGGYVASAYNPQAFGIFTQGDCVDVFGNCWINTPGILGGGAIHVIDPTATTLQTYTWESLTTAICTYAQAHQSPGASWTESGHSVFDQSGGLAAFTEDGVTYLLVSVGKWMASGNRWFDTIAVLEPAADGTYTVMGVTWGFAFSIFEVGSHFDIRCKKIDLAGQKTADDPIVLLLGLNDTGLAPCVKVFPSINATLGVASALDQTRYLWPGSWFNPGDTYYGFGLTQALGVNAGSDQSIFVMPGPAGVTEIMYYISPTSMAATGQVFVVANLKPTYPNGCLAKAILPTTGFAFTTGFPVRTDDALPAPVAAPGVFVTAEGVPYDSFTDSGYFYDGAPGDGGLAEYYAVPRLIAAQGDGWLLGWYHPWFEDTSYTFGTNWTFKERLRLQTYSAATGLFTDVTILEGPTAPINDLGGGTGALIDFMDVNGWALVVDADGISIWHFNGPSATGAARWVTWRGLIAGPAPPPCSVRLFYHRRQALDG